MAVSPIRFESREDPQTDYFEGLPDTGVHSVYGLPDPLVLGGLYTSKAHQGLYNPLLEHPGSLLPAKARYLPPLGKGLVAVEEMIGQMEEEIADRAEQLEGPVDVTAHSLGMHIGMAVALRRPELFRSFTGLGGIGCGIESLTPAAHLVKAVLRKAAGVEDIMRGSDYMQQHERAVATEWSPDIPVLLIGHAG
jgi:pimeloyl-ACP methyl ester carboxylesterase